LQIGNAANHCRLASDVALVAAKSWSKSKPTSFPMTQTFGYAGCQPIRLQELVLGELWAGSNFRWRFRALSVSGRYRLGYLLLMSHDWYTLMGRIPGARLAGRT